MQVLSSKTLQTKTRKALDVGFNVLCVFSTLLGVFMLLALLTKVFSEAIPWLDWQFITSSPSRFASKAGILPLLLGSLYLMLLVIIIAVPLGVASAIYLEEYAPKTFFTKLIEINISNLAGIPSIVYGLLGLGIFISIFNMGAGVLLVGAFTLSLRVLPIIIISTQESIRTVPYSYKEAAYGLGASQWEVIRTVSLPGALPGILTGIILALANAIGESAPLIMIGVATTIFRAPHNILSAFGALPLQIYAWADLPQSDFQHGVTPAAIVVLLVILIICNASTIIIRNKYQKKTTGI